MWLYPSIAFENTIQQNNWPGYFSSCSKKKNIISCDLTSIKKNLLAASIQIGRFSSSKCWNFMSDTDVITCDSFACNANAIYCIKNFKVSCPPIRQATHGESTMMIITDSN
jgi:hypothetical protein